MTFIKYSVFTLSLFLTIHVTAQTGLAIKKETEKNVSLSDKALFKFVAENNFNYALIGWTESGWMSGQQTIYCLVEQNEKWFLAEITKYEYKHVDEKPVEYPYIEVKEKRLSANRADSLLGILKPDSAFLYTQWDFDNLPRECTYLKNGEKSTFVVLCSYTDHLLQYSPSGKYYLNFYSPKDYFEYCYPYLPGFKILKGFVNTTDLLRNEFRED